ncbi:MAG: hypothetical protein GQ574_10770 [Crocinitomix sp.]|nr:hypothetical protein [Crocinitomix sp.]
MTFTSIGYLSFFSIMFYVIGVIGWQFYKDGKFYLERFFEKELHLVDSINKLLLLGYYLFNLGYIALTINGWSNIHSLPELIDTVAWRSGKIILTLALMHYANLWWLSHFHDIKAFFKQKTNKLKQ